MRAVLRVILFLQWFSVLNHVIMSDDSFSISWSKPRIQKLSLNRLSRTDYLIIFICALHYPVPISVSLVLRSTCVKFVESTMVRCYLTTTTTVSPYSSSRHQALSLSTNKPIPFQPVEGPCPYFRRHGQIPFGRPRAPRLVGNP